MKTVRGTVRDWVLDCGHLTVSDGSFDVLHDALSEFEDEEVEITIRLTHKRRGGDNAVLR